MAAWVDVVAGGLGSTAVAVAVGLVRDRVRDRRQETARLAAEGAERSAGFAQELGELRERIAALEGEAGTFRPRREGHGKPAP